MNHRLETKHLTKSFKTRRVVKDISLSLSSGEVVGLLGPNGAGKTTSFYMIIGLVQPSGGQVLLDDVDITAMPMHRRSQLGLGYLPQEASVFRKMTVEQNILAILESRKSLSKKDRQDRLEELIGEFHLNPVRDSLGISLSGGERRRCEIARALACDPKFILLDEPFAGVDPISVMDIKKEIARLATKGIGVLITDHNVRETLDICCKATIVSEGLVISNGTPKTVMENKQVREVYLGEEFRL